MKIGINHQIIRGTKPEEVARYDAWWEAVSPWVDLIRCDTHMGAYAWRVDPKHVYSNGDDAMKPWRELGVRANIAGVEIDLIRDGFPTSPEWKAIGGDWSTFDEPNTWREWCVPSVAWSKVNAWVNAVAKALIAAGASTRWQGPNECFDRGHDRHSFKRMLNIYAQSSYSRKWTGPALWGDGKLGFGRENLLRQLGEWETMRKYGEKLDKAEFVAINVYPDYKAGVTVDVASNLKRQVENLVIVDEWASKRGLKVVIPEFGFAKIQTTNEAERVALTAFVFDCAALLPSIDTLTLYWDSGDYFISNEGLKEIGRKIGTSPDAAEYVKAIQDSLTQV